MRKHPPYLEIMMTVAAMGFLGLVVIGGFDQRSAQLGQVITRSD